MKRKMAKGKQSVMNGRALFTYNPDLFQDNEEATDDVPTKKMEEESKVDEDLFAQEEV
jgi:hypothetical protein